MAKSISTITVEASPEVVWEHLVDPEKMRRWRTDVVELDLPPGDLELGYRYVATRQEGRRHVPYQMEVTELDEGKHIAFLAESSSATVHAEYDIEPAGSGTRVTFQERVALPGLIGALVDKFLLPRMLAKALDIITDNLRSVVDGDGEVRPIG